MGKIFGILFIVVAIWVALEVFTEGVDGAFGGVFAGGSPPAASAPGDVAPRRRPAAAEAAERNQKRAYQAGVDRVDGQMEQMGE
jgi:hypothetical protein